MNSWIPAVDVTGWTLVHFVWQGALIGLAAASAMRGLRAASPRARYVAACAALAAMVASPVLTARMLTQMSPAPIAGAPAPGASSAIVNDRSDETPAMPKPAVNVPNGRLRIEPFLPLVVAVWLAGVLCLLVRLTGGWWRVHQLHVQSLAAAASNWQRASDRMAARLRVFRRIHVVDSCMVDTPTVVGWLRPVVLLPIAALANLTPAQVDAILAHELAHIRRHDFLVNLLQTAAETLLFYHPAVWWVSGRIRAEREQCCDDVVLGVCGDAVGYVSALAELEARRSAPGQQAVLALAATSGPLLDRARRMLGAPTADERRTSHSIVAVALALLFIGGAAGAPQLQSRQLVQSLAGAPPVPVFEVASVKPNKSGAIGVNFRNPPDGRFTATNAPVRDLILFAYGIQNFQIVGGPDWINTDRFDIIAKADGNPPPSQMRLMMRALLADRFRLATHDESRELPIYALVLARNDKRLGASIKPSGPDCAPMPVPPGAAAPPAAPPGVALGARGRSGPADPTGPPRCGAMFGPGHIAAHEMTMTQLANGLSRLVRRTVVDRTGLTGGFDLDVDFTPDQVSLGPGGQLVPTAPPSLPPADSNGPSIFTALQEQAGLKLDATKGRVDVLVIDRVDRPTED